MDSEGYGKNLHRLIFSYSPFLALHPPLSLLTHHRDNVTAPHGRSNLRSRLHSCHTQEEGPPKSTKGPVVALDKKKKSATILPLTWNTRKKKTRPDVN